MHREKKWGEGEGDGTEEEREKGEGRGEAKGRKKINFGIITFTNIELKLYFLEIFRCVSNEFRNYSHVNPFIIIILVPIAEELMINLFVYSFYNQTQNQENSQYLSTFHSPPPRLQNSSSIYFYITNPQVLQILFCNLFCLLLLFLVLDVCPIAVILNII